jgi:undecaprenyl-diphosphatase
MLTAFLLGIVEGLTEFLPVSSTGHLILASRLLRYRGDEANRFIIVIQIGAILAVVWEFRRPLITFVKETCSQPLRGGFLLKLVLAFLPVAIVGFFTHEALEALFFSPTSVALALIAGGIVILAIELGRLSFEVRDVEKVSWRQALGIGIAQVTSLIPGVSRSGATIMGGLVFGLGRKAATEFSFYLAIPTMLAAGSYALATEWIKGGAWDFAPLFIGFVTSFLSALCILRPFIRYVQSHSFVAFAYYRILLGGILLFLPYFFT